MWSGLFFLLLSLILLKIYKHKAPICEVCREKSKFSEGSGLLKIKRTFNLFVLSNGSEHK